MDGVIVDSEPLHKTVEREMFADFGMDVSVERQHAFTGTSNAIMWTQLKAEYNLPETVEHYVEIKEERYLKRLATDKTVQLISGVESVLAGLEKAGMPLALASSSSLENIKLVLDRFNLNRYFKSITSGVEVPFSKPNPDVFLLAAKRLGVEACHCMVVEDSTNGVKAAKAAGMYCVGLKVDEDNRQDLSLADRVITSFAEFENVYFAESFRSTSNQ